jgi:hypothetical protein
MKVGDEQQDGEPMGTRSAEELHGRTPVPAPPERYVAYPYTLLEMRVAPGGEVGRRSRIAHIVIVASPPGLRRGSSKGRRTAGNVAKPLAVLGMWLLSCLA